MKKAIAFLFLILFSLTCYSAYAETNSQVIVLVSFVKETQPQFALRNSATGDIGSSLVYSTDAIYKDDVTASFEIVQTNTSLCSGVVSLSVKATELVAKKNNKYYTTSGLNIIENGTNLGSSAEFTLNYNGYRVPENTVVKTFDVKWYSNPNLVKANYEAAILLNYMVY